jgi:hypothetical protein
MSRSAPSHPTILSASRFARAARCSHHLEVCTGRFWVRVCVWRGLLVMVPGLSARPISMPVSAMRVRAATPLFSLPLAFPAPRAALVTSKYVLAAFECVFACGADCWWWCPGSARVPFRCSFPPCFRAATHYILCLSLFPCRALLPSPRGMYRAHLGMCLRVARTVASSARARRASHFDALFRHVFSCCDPTILSASRFSRAARCSRHLEVCTGRL